MAMKFTEIDPDVARASLAKKQRTSKHRETLQAFFDAGIAAAQVELEIDPDTGKEPNKASVASGLSNALTTAKENKMPWAHKIRVRNRADGVYLINLDLLPEDDEDDTEDDAGTPEPVGAGVGVGGDDE